MSNTIKAAIADDFRHASMILSAFCADPENLARIEKLARHLADMFRTGGKVMACGNGGSACDALHFAEEFTGRYRHNRPALGAIACGDAGHITCTANDFGYESVFSRWVDGLGRPGDCLVVLSTSGNSENIARAIEAAARRDMTTVALLGKGGGRLKGMADFEWIVPGFDDPATNAPAQIYADRIQEIHMLLLHTLINAVERCLFPGGINAEGGLAEVKGTAPVRL